MDRKRRRKESIWASYFRNAEKCLTGILYSLKVLPNHKIKSSEKRKPIGTELYKLDFETGATFSGTPLFFKPRVGGTCKVTNTGQDYENDGEMISPATDASERKGSIRMVGSRFLLPMRL